MDKGIKNIANTRQFLRNYDFSRNYSSFASSKLEYQKCYRILGISENSDQEEIRSAYLKLVKQYHPDSKSGEANAAKFSEIDRAFKTLINKKSKERWQVEDVDAAADPNVKDAAPQHRQYLSFGGFGSGTPFQREKQYAKIRAMQAAENVLQHRISKVSAEEGALLAKTPAKHKIKTKYGFDRLVEDLIQESMSKGEFSNLKGIGKPLTNQNFNPYVDFVTHKLNEVLIDNGFTPEWITLHKEIREDLHELRNALLTERTYYGPSPLKPEENDSWVANVFGKFETTIGDINKKIDKFNLVVPILDKQMTQISLQKEADRALVNGKNCEEVDQFQRDKDELNASDSSGNETSTMFGFFEKLFKVRQ